MDFNYIFNDIIYKATDNDIINYINNGTIISNDGGNTYQLCLNNVQHFNLSKESVIRISKVVRDNKINKTLYE